MADYNFERDCRTPYSEAYYIEGANDERLGRVDIHYTPNVVYATLCVREGISQEEIQDLIEAIDEQLVMTADVFRDDFVVTVYQGREIGVFSDEDLEEEEEEAP